MNTTVYVDVLLIINYIINLLLILCTAKLSGIRPKRRKIVAAALVGSLCSLTIFLPFMGFFAEFFARLSFSALIVRIALPYYNLRTYIKQWFIFFAASFFFAGAILALWMLFAPQWLLYYNGILYLDISSFTLLVSVIAAYLLLLAGERAARAGRLPGSLCKVQIYLGGRMCALDGLVDTGNALTEPFSGAPVIVCGLDEAAPLLPEAAVELLRQYPAGALPTVPAFRLIPYRALGKSGVLPAFAPDRLMVKNEQGAFLVEQAYVALSLERVGDARYSVLLSPDLIRHRAAAQGRRDSRGVSKENTRKDAQNGRWYNDSSGN